MSINLTAILAPKIDFASHQNSVPVVQELTLRNTGEELLENLVVTLSADPLFLETKIWKIDVMKPGDELRVNDRDIRLGATFLSELSESLRGTVDIEVFQGDAGGISILRQSHPVELLAKTHWGGVGSMPELLPAFCMPNDPAVDKVLKASSDILRRAGKRCAIDGYEDRSRSRTWELTSSIWSSMVGLGLGYALPPASFQIEGQKIRTPGTVLEGKLATCLDTSMLFASALEQAGLNPLIILTEGHAFVGVWLQPQEFSQLITDEAAAVRKRIELQELVVFETTLVTNAPAPPFSTAVEIATRKLSDDEFLMAIDIRRARMRKIKPLGFNTVFARATDVGEGEISPPGDSLEEAPALPGFDVEIVTEPESAEDRVAQWQRKLLDLTARNRLLHLPERSKHVPLVCPDPGALEDLLAAGKTIRISPFPDFAEGGRDAALYQQLNLGDLQEQYAGSALSSNEVISSLPKTKLEAELIDLYRKANTDISEGGANTLFLALGFLNWKKSADDTRVYRAPLILLPVKLNRRSALSGVTMTAHEDEPRFNLTLLELLRQDFDLNIPGLDGALPEDASGIDVSGIWTRVRLAVKEIPGFEVTTETAISTFSFSKYLMWKDLVDRREQLITNPVVKHLMERGEERFSDGPEFPSDRDLDALISPSDLFTPLPADSSQLSAVVASGRGCDFVLDGPPGTGKSQTIANMIVHNLLQGKRVLFVAEKMAALDVVYRRLEEKGLGEFCLEVHSHKASKLEILQQLDRAWNIRGDLTKEEWDRDTHRLRDLRDRLNLMCECLHHRHPNGITVHLAVGRVARDHGSATPRLVWSRGTTHSTEEYTSMIETAHRLDLNHDAYRDSPDAFSIITQTEWSNGWQDTVLGIARLIPSRIDALTAARDRVLEACQLNISADEDSSMELLTQLTKTLLKTFRQDFAFGFAVDLNERLESAGRFVSLLGEYQAEEQLLSVPYAEEAVRRIDIDLTDIEWAIATGKFWILATLAQKKVAKSLAARGGTTGLPDVPADLPRLRRMKSLLVEMDSLAPHLNGIPGYAALRSKATLIEESAAVAAALKQAISRLISNPDELVALKSAIRRRVVDANELLDPEGRVALASTALESALSDYRIDYARFVELCTIIDPDSLSFARVRDACTAITSNETRLRLWCTWRRVRDEALRLNLAPLVSGIEDGTLAKSETEPAFLTGYAKWFAAEMIDREPLLRDFVSVEHMDCIEEFRSLDDRVAQLIVDYARTALASRLPSKTEVGRRDGYGILKHELQKKRRHKPLRQLITEMGDSFGLLAPCMLMSPLSIAQYLPVELQLFDLVIFDEASQIAPWDAVGAIARGSQVIVAGDPRQMPPTNFFQRGTGDGAIDGNVEEDLESILDECLAVGIPRHSLSWHYRSRHESLIAFSNSRYYGGNLVTFPAAETRESAVTWRRVQGIYAKGKGRTNEVEAKAIVAETVKRLVDPAFKESGWTIAIITLNGDQQALIENLLDAARRQHPEIEPFFDQTLPEPVVVKSLETVQGDERDVIFLGVGYGPTDPGAGTMSMNFGPLNRDGGERRLNVAITRSRREMVVFTSFDPSMIDLNRTSARAVRDLKHFLEFADRGPRALGEAVHGSVGGYDSPFEEAVSRRLQEKGWQVVPQVGVSRFRIDLGIVHPERPGDFLVGVECDGATYHRAATARDRDKVRAAVLEGLGWNLLRVWSTDWFVDPEREIERLDASLRALLEADLASRAVAETATEPEITGFDDTSETVTSFDPSVSLSSTVLSPDDAGFMSLSPAASIGSPSAGRIPYRLTDYTAFTEQLQPDRFYDETYTPVLHDLVRHTLETESPISDDLLVNRIARAHDFKRSGRLIRDRVLAIIDQHYHLREDPVGGNFIWLHEDATTLPLPAREPATPDSIRAIEAIPAEEIRAALPHATKGDPSVEIARIFGILRLSSAGRERIEKAIGVANQGVEAADFLEEPNLFT